MSFLRSVVDGISSVSNMVTANISPYKVQATKSESYDSKSIVEKSPCIVLYKKPGCYDCVFSNLRESNKYFSLFRLTKEGETMIFYKGLVRILGLMAANSSSLCREETLQNVCDAVREHPTWSVAHVAGYIGLFEVFKVADVQKEINTCDGISGITPLMAAAIGGQKHCIHEMLIHKAQLDLADKKGMTVYHYAVRYVPQVLDYLFEHDQFKVYDWMDERGETALYKACADAPEKTADQERHVTVEMLLVGGADPALNKRGKMPIHVAVEKCEKKCIELIIKKHPGQKNAREKKYQATPLHLSQTREMTELLCQLGCDVDAVSATQHTPLQVMMMRGREECVMELLCYGANANIGDSNGDTPLHWSVQRDDVVLVRTFVVFGADVNQKNTQNHSPRHMASISKGKNKEGILHMLHTSGAYRCTDKVKGCMAGCSVEGRSNGQPDENTKPFLTLDKMALFDDMLCTAVNCSASMDAGKGEAIMDLTDGPTDIGDTVLCLDGGGIKGLILIQLLSALEEAAEMPIKDLFDWIGGTSTGGILALGIGVGKTLPYLRGLYFRLKDEVFKGGRPYDSTPLENLLKQEFGETKKMTDIKHPKVMVTGVLADRFPAELHLFRTYIPTLNKPAENKGKNKDFEKIQEPNEQLIWKSARSTGAAPTYFRTFGQYMDGGVMANNPTLDVLTEIHEYNMGRKFMNEPEQMKPLGCVVSFGCGRVPQIARDHIDVFKPSGIMEAHKVIKGTTALVSLLIDQASVAEGRPVERARAWCSMMNVPFYRFSPQLSEDIPLDCSDNKTLINMLWETQCYIVANKHRLQQVAQLLRAGRKGAQERRHEPKQPSAPPAPTLSMKGRSQSVQLKAAP